MGVLPLQFPNKQRESPWSNGTPSETYDIPVRGTQQGVTLMQPRHRHSRDSVPFHLAPSRSASMRGSRMKWTTWNNDGILKPILNGINQIESITVNHNGQRKMPTKLSFPSLPPNVIQSAMTKASSIYASSQSCSRHKNVLSFSSIPSNRRLFITVVAVRSVPRHNMFMEIGVSTRRHHPRHHDDLCQTQEIVVG